MGDCDALLAARDTLAGSRSLNWLADTPITYWDGVTVDGTPQRVTGLDLLGIGLTGEIPVELGNLTNLTELDLYFNWLTGTIPMELGDLANLQRLNLGSNQLTGEIPTELGNLTNLTELTLWGNELTGEIPTELGNLINLTELTLNHNQLTGEIPTELGNLTNLTVLSLYYNQLTGEIPTELGNLANLTELFLSNNELTGRIPTELGRLTNLQVLYLGANQLTGEIPVELGSLTGLQRLYIVDGNQLSGCLREAVSQLLPNLLGTDVGVVPSCTGENVVVSADGDPQIYNGNVFVLPIAEDIATDSELPLSHYATRFFEYFDDEFDFLFFAFLVKDNVRNYAGRYHPAKNDVEGIGLESFSHGDRYGSAGKLQGVIELTRYYQFNSFLTLHELMHRWANYLMPIGSGFGSHWGFSSAYGLLGGFDIEYLVDHGDSRYSADHFSATGSSTTASGYSTIELYLAGLIPPEEVPDLWVAEDGRMLRAEDGKCVRDHNRYCMFTASKVRTYTIEDIIEEHGDRNPDFSQAQRDFRAAAILLIDENIPATKWVLDKLSAEITAFSYAGTVESDDTHDFADNFYEATGGRATITMDGLSQFWKGGR